MEGFAPSSFFSTPGGFGPGEDPMFELGQLWGGLEANFGGGQLEFWEGAGGQIGVCGYGAMWGYT